MWLYLNILQAVKYQTVGVILQDCYESCKKVHFHAFHYLLHCWFTKRIPAYQNISLDLEQN